MATRVRPVETEPAAPTPSRRTSHPRKTAARPRTRKVVPLPARERFINRHLSWLDFDSRVLALGERPDWPLLERAKFLAIFSSNLDEFFQVRVAELDEQSELGVMATSPEGLSPAEQLALVRAKSRELQARQDRVFEEEVRPALAEAGIRLADWDDLTEGDRHHLGRVFEERIFPVLTPLSVDPAHPFPYISNLSLNLAVVVRDPVTRAQRFARVKVPPLLPRFQELPDGVRFVPIEQVIAAHLDSLFPGMEIVAQHPFRVTRNADLDLQEDEVEDLRAAMESVLQLRRRSPHAVRLEVTPTMPDSTRDLLVRELELEPEDVYVVGRLLDLSSLWSLYDLPRPELKFEPWTSQTQRRLAAVGGEAPDLFAVLKHGDVLVHHPYDSFTTSIVAFIDQAAGDPDVMAIKQTLYRTSTQESPIVKALIRAAEAGKQVVALVELKARFDEQANMAWGDALEKAGVHVVYGLVGLKTHAKVSLVVRREAKGIRRYCHVGTGNYNPTTARLYEDVGILSSDRKLGADLTDLFNYLTGYSRKRRYRRLLVAPLTLRQQVLDLIAKESRPGGRIVLKMNSLVDQEMVEALYSASEAGCEIDLVVRGICCLRPGVPGLSARIRVRSLVGRYLEHSRIFRFGSDDGPRYFIGSADLMPRNLDYRVEAITPVEDPAQQRRLEEILRVNLSDDDLAWELGPDGTWTKVPCTESLNAQVRFQELALARAMGLEG
jgi:polyphosphate kinase